MTPTGAETLAAWPGIGDTLKIVETDKAFERRQREGFFARYTQGPGIDIGCSTSPVTPDCDKWDKSLGHGDATTMTGVPDCKYDYVYSSHCLEHLDDPITALRNWWRILRPCGWLIVMVPHRDLYEKRLTLPSRWNADHKYFWLPVWSEPPHTLGLIAVAISALGETFWPQSLRVLDEGFGNSGEYVHSSGEYSIEMILRKLRE